MSTPSPEEMTTFLDEQVRLDRAVGEAWVALKDAVSARHALYEGSSPRAARVCAIARKLYERRPGGGFANGDNPVIVGAIMIDGKNGTAVVGPFAPAWGTFVQDAEELLQIEEGLDRA